MWDQRVPRAAVSVQATLGGSGRWFFCAPQRHRLAEMDWVLWSVSVTVALLGGLWLGYLGRASTAGASGQGSAAQAGSSPGNDADRTDDQRSGRVPSGGKGDAKIHPGGSSASSGGGSGPSGSLSFVGRVASTDDSQDGDDGKSRLVVIVSFRLPVRATRRADGSGWAIEWDDPFARNVFADLKALRRTDREVRWVGTVPGASNVPRREQDALEDALAEYDCYPVFLSPAKRELFYHGFCKGIMWPLFHYVMPQAARVDTDFGARWDETWKQYRAGNMLFAKAVTSAIENNDDSVWVHGYHLLLVPSLVRRRMPKARIGMFVHEPWPSSDVFRSLPARDNILRGMLACDLIGFHTYDYARHFLSCCKRILNLDFHNLVGGLIGVSYSGRTVAVRVNHVGTRTPFFATLAKSQRVREETKRIAEKYRGKTVILSVDYMDLTKGPQMKFQSFARFLKAHPEKRKELVLAQVILPSSNQDKKEVERLVMDEINLIRDKYGKDLIDVIDNPALHTLVAYYALSQVAIISVFWDGLNLIPYEYTASQSIERPGALIVSEFMGCSRSLSGVIRVNPWSIDDVAAAINSALDMSLAKRQAAFARRKRYVAAHTLIHWATDFLDDLERASTYNSNLRFVSVGFASDVRLVGLRSDFAPADLEEIKPIYDNAQVRLILLDYDGTLVDEQGLGSVCSPSPRLKSILTSLCADERNLVFIVNGRTRKDLVQFFGDIDNLGLCAEQGSFVRWPARVAGLLRPKLTRQESPWRKALDVKASDVKSSGVTDVVSPGDAKTRDAKAPWEADSVGAESVGANEWYTMSSPDELAWKRIAMQVIEEYNARTDGARIEDREHAIVWFFDQADPDFGLMQARELQKCLTELLSEDYQISSKVSEFNKFFEIRPQGVGKGFAARHLMQTLSSRLQGRVFYMALGDDEPDEEMFEALADGKSDGISSDGKSDSSQSVFTICVGLRPSKAHYYVNDPPRVQELLAALGGARSGDVDDDDTGGGAMAFGGAGMGGLGGSRGSLSGLSGGSLSGLAGSSRGGLKSARSLRSSRA